MYKNTICLFGVDGIFFGKGYEKVSEVIGRRNHQLARDYLGSRNNFKRGIIRIKWGNRNALSLSKGGNEKMDHVGIEGV